MTKRRRTFNKEERSAALDKVCPGFQALEKAHQEFEANYFAIIKGEH